MAALAGYSYFELISGDKPNYTKGISALGRGKMDGSSSSEDSAPITMLKGDNYKTWSTKLKEQLISKGVWGCVEPETMKLVNDGEAKVALSVIRHSLSLSPPSIITKMVSDASTPKIAWELLRSLFGPIPKMDVIEEEPSLKSTPVPVSDEKPFFDVTLTKSAVSLPYQLSFPVKVSELLPSTHLTADVMFEGRIFELTYYGKKKQKSVGSGLREVVRKYKLEEGETLRFQILESNDCVLKMSMQRLEKKKPMAPRPPPPPPPQQLQPRPKRSCRAKPIIDLDDEDDYSD